MYNNPYILDVSDLEPSQRRALAESVVGAHPTVIVDEDDLPEQQTWTLRKWSEATPEEYEEEIEYILFIFQDAVQGKLIPVDPYY